MPILPEQEGVEKGSCLKGFLPFSFFCLPISMGFPLVSLPAKRSFNSVGPRWGRFCKRAWERGPKSTEFPGKRQTNHKGRIVFSQPQNLQRGGKELEEEKYTQNTQNAEIARRSLPLPGTPFPLSPRPHPFSSQRRIARSQSIRAVHSLIRLFLHDPSPTGEAAGILFREEKEVFPLTKGGRGSAGIWNGP